MSRFQTKQVGNKMVASGYALKFGTKSRNLGGFYEIISPRALDNTDMSDVHCFFAHDNSKVLGRLSSGTLKLHVDEVGLYFECEFPDTAQAADVFKLIERGDVSKCSFGFSLGEGADSWSRDGEDIIRTIDSIESLYEISLVAIPAYDDTNVQVALRNFKETEALIKRQLEIKVRLAKFKCDLENNY